MLLLLLPVDLLLMVKTWKKDEEVMAKVVGDEVKVKVRMRMMT